MDACVHALVHTCTFVTVCIGACAGVCAHVHLGKAEKHRNMPLNGSCRQPSRQLNQPRRSPRLSLEGYSQGGREREAVSVDPTPPPFWGAISGDSPPTSVMLLSLAHTAYFRF